MSTYNLNDNVRDFFEFTLNGHQYQMKYPTVEDTEKVQSALKEAETSDDAPDVAEMMYSFISSNDKDAPPIEQALKKQNIRVLQNFNEMIKKEFGGE